jgi:hypothetical protein
MEKTWTPPTWKMPLAFSIAGPGGDSPLNCLRPGANRSPNPGCKLPQAWHLGSAITRPRIPKITCIYVFQGLVSAPVTPPAIEG